LLGLFQGVVSHHGRIFFLSCHFTQ
jgi:hypothetical protein